MCIDSLMPSRSVWQREGGLTMEEKLGHQEGRFLYNINQFKPTLFKTTCLVHAWRVRSTHGRLHPNVIHVYHFYFYIQVSYSSHDGNTVFPSKLMGQITVCLFLFFSWVLSRRNWWNSRKSLWFFCTFMVISVLSLLRQTHGSFSESRIAAALTPAYCAVFPPLFMDARCFSAMVVLLAEIQLRMQMNDTCTNCLIRCAHQQIIFQDSNWQVVLLAA